MEIGGKIVVMAVPMVGMALSRKVLSTKARAACQGQFTDTEPDGFARATRAREPVRSAYYLLPNTPISQDHPAG